MTAIQDSITEAQFEALVESRSIVVAEAISDATYRHVVNLLTVMERKSESKPVRIFVNSPGGSADSGFAIRDRLIFSPVPITTIANGLVASSAVMVFLSAAKGQHYALPNARFLLHQPSTMARGQASDIDITAKEISKIRLQYNQIVSAHTQKTVDMIEADAKRDFWLNANEARDYGLVEKVITQRHEIG